MRIALACLLLLASCHKRAPTHPQPPYFQMHRSVDGGWWTVCPDADGDYFAARTFEEIFRGCMNYAEALVAPHVLRWQSRTTGQQGSGDTLPMRQCAVWVRFADEKWPQVKHWCEPVKAP